MNLKGVGSCVEELRKAMKTSVRIAGISAEIPTEHLPNTSRYHYPLDVHMIEN
jgi:hypothetical protein